MNKFSEFADLTLSPTMDGKKSTLEDILGRELVVLNYVVKNTKYADAKNPDCLMVQFSFTENPEEHRVFFTGSRVLLNQLERYKDKIPFAATIKKVGKYFTFS